MYMEESMVELVVELLYLGAEEHVEKRIGYRRLHGITVLL